MWLTHDLVLQGLLARWCLTLPSALTSVGWGSRLGCRCPPSTLLGSEKHWKRNCVWNSFEILLVSKWLHYISNHKMVALKRGGHISHTTESRDDSDLPVLRSSLLLCSSRPVHLAHSFVHKWCLLLLVKYIFKSISRMLTVDLLNNPYPVLGSLSRQGVKCVWKLGIQS